MKIPDWAVRTKADERALELGFYWDDTEANKVKNFIERYCHQTKGGWSKPPTLLDFQLEDIIFPFYSWYDPQGKPRFNSLYLFSSRKIGKTFLSAALCAYDLCTSHRPEVLVLSSTVRQSKNIFDTIDGFREDKVLQKILKPQEHNKRILNKQNKGQLQILSATNTIGTSGHNPSMMYIDELMEIRASAAQSVIGRLKNSGMAKIDGVCRTILTSTPQDQQDHPGRRLWDYAKAIQDGDIVDDLTVLPAVYTADPALEAGDPVAWKQANPGLGQIVPYDVYEKDYIQSKDNPHELARFETLLLGRWVSSLNAFIHFQTWEQCKEEFSEADFYGDDVVMAVDWGGRHDLLSWCLMAKRDNKYYVLPRFALPKKIIDRKVKQDSTDYLGWAQAGLVHVCDGDTIDLAWWHDLLEDDLQHFNVKTVAIDDYNLESTRQWLEEEKCIDVVTVKTNMYTQMNLLTNRFEAMVQEQQIAHNGNEMMDWNIKSMTIRTDANGQIKPDKKSGKIDGCIAMIVSLAAIEYIEQANDFCGVIV